MRTGRWILTSCPLLLLLAATGCGSHFAGEWVEEGSFDQDGVFHAATGERRLAFRFEPPATVRYGALINRAGVVDHQSVQSDTYLTMQNRRVAEFGSVIARVDRGRLIATIAGDVVTRFERVRGPRVFPPVAVLPSLSKANDVDEMTPARPEAGEAVAAAP
jgi:hypothetical protein